MSLQFSIANVSLVRAYIQRKLLTKGYLEEELGFRQDQDRGAKTFHRRSVGSLLAHQMLIEIIISTCTYSNERINTLTLLQETCEHEWH